MAQSRPVRHEPRRPEQEKTYAFSLVFLVYVEVKAEKAKDQMSVRLVRLRSHSGEEQRDSARHRKRNVRFAALNPRALALRSEAWAGGFFRRRVAVRPIRRGGGPAQLWR